MNLSHIPNQAEAHAARKALRLHISLKSVRDDGIMQPRRHAEHKRRLREERRIAELKEVRWRLSATDVQTRPDDMMALIIQIKVAQCAGIEFLDLFDPTRWADGIGDARHICYFLLSERGYTVAEISTLFGFKNHDSTRHGIQKTVNYRDRDPAFRDLLNRIVGELSRGIERPVE